MVARMVLTSTLIMVISMTFGLPYGAYGAIYGLILSRESLEATAGAVRSVVIGFAIAVAYILLGYMLALGDPFTRFIWIVGGFLAGFWAMSALRSYAASGRFGYLIAITITLWDRHVPTSQKVENTLWAAGVITFASFIVLMVEIVFARLTKVDVLMDGMAERLGCVEALFSAYASGEPVDPLTQKAISRLTTTGISRLRMNLNRSGFGSQHATEMGAVVALTGRLVDLAGNLPHLARSAPDSDRERIAAAAAQIREIRRDLLRGAIPRRELPESDAALPNIPTENWLENVAK